MFASLSNVMGHWDNLPSPMPNDIKEYKLYDVETKYGLLQVRVHTVWSNILEIITNTHQLTCEQTFMVLAMAFLVYCA